MLRDPLPRKAKDEGRRKAKIQSLVSPPVVISEPLKKRVKRAANGLRPSGDSGDDKNSNPVYAKNVNPIDLDFVPLSIRNSDDSKQGYHTSPYFSMLIKVSNFLALFSKWNHSQPEEARTLTSPG